MTTPAFVKKTPKCIVIVDSAVSPLRLTYASCGEPSALEKGYYIVHILCYTAFVAHKARSEFESVSLRFSENSLYLRLTHLNLE